MSIISFKAADVLATKVAEAGNYKMVCTKIEGPHASTSRKSVSYFADFKFTEGDLMGKELKIAFNSNTNSVSLLGGVQYMPMRAMLALDAAVHNVPLEPVDRPDFDTEDLVDKPFTGVVTVDTTEGVLGNLIAAFYPENYDGGTPF